MAFQATYFSCLLSKRKDLQLSFSIIGHPPKGEFQEGGGGGQDFSAAGREHCMTPYTGLAEHSLYCVKQLDFRTRRSHLLNSNKTKQI